MDLMGKFLTELDMRLKPGRDDVWLMNSPLIFDSELVGRIEVPVMFETDLASVPRVPVVYSIWGGRAHREAVIHDFLFRIDSTPEVSWWMANRVFLEAMESRGKAWNIRYPMYFGVCLGSHGCYHRRNVFDGVA